LLNPTPDPTLSEAIGKYLEETLKTAGKTKAQVLASIQRSAIGTLQCSQVTSPRIIQFLQALPGQPQTRGNYLSHLSSVIRVAGPAWGYPLSAVELDSARTVAVHMGLISRSRHRDRRPTLAELDRLLTHFAATRSARVDAIPMVEIVVYAIFSTRRESEITRQVFEDLDELHSELWVRDMKHPGEKAGNDVRTHLTPEALRLVIKRRGADQARTSRIWPYNAESISSRFTRACQLLGIDDLVFHDLRHDGISRLFELGWTIPQVATVSGHRSWASLQRYTHIRAGGDRYAGWPWLERLGIAA
jgi:integrase